MRTRSEAYYYTSCVVNIVEERGGAWMAMPWSGHECAVTICCFMRNAGGKVMRSTQPEWAFFFLYI